LPENGAVYENVGKNMVEPDRPQVAVEHNACALPAG